MTPAEWEAEKARIDEERKRLVEMLHEYDRAQLMRENFAKRKFPYPEKPEKTVTLSDGQVWRRNAGRFEFRVSDGGWFGFRDDADVRLLASLLPENEPTKET